MRESNCCYAIRNHCTQPREEEGNTGATMCSGLSIKYVSSYGPIYLVKGCFGRENGLFGNCGGCFGIIIPTPRKIGPICMGKGEGGG